MLTFNKTNFSWTYLSLITKITQIFHVVRSCPLCFINHKLKLIKNIYNYICILTFPEKSQSCHFQQDQTSINSAFGTSEACEVGPRISNSWSFTEVSFNTFRHKATLRGFIVLLFSLTHSYSYELGSNIYGVWDDALQG